RHFVRAVQDSTCRWGCDLRVGDGAEQRPLNLDARRSGRPAAQNHDRHSQELLRDGGYLWDSGRSRKRRQYRRLPEGGECDAGPRTRLNRDWLRNLGGVEIFHPALFFGKPRLMTGFSVAVIICTLSQTLCDWERAHENYRSGSFVACDVISGRSK